MQEKLLTEIRAMLLQRRATTIRDQVNLAESEDDVVVMTLEDGTEHRMLSWKRALRLATEEMQRNMAIIERALAD